MLSVANVRTAGGAASYFAADNYYTRADADRSGAWLGKGAEELGLTGAVDAKTFESVLKGFLPDGSRVGSDFRAHRAGTDLTFSMPKSWSVLALVGGDKRILDAYGAAVRETLTWAEKNLAETRMDVRGSERVVRTGNLVAAVFQHDTNRNQEPNAHFHAVIANATQGPDGKWRALRNDNLWQHNILRTEGKTVLGLAVQNTLVQMLERETGIPSMTVARFLGQHQDILKGEGGARLEAARTAMSGTVVVLDEASMVGNADMEKLVRLANLLKLDRFASIGDTRQLGAVDAGKPFDVMQQAGIEAAHMETNLRARDDALRSAQRAAQGGRIGEALAHLGENVIAVDEDAAVDAAAAWLSLAPKEREVTAIYASGRTLRGEVNEAVQTGLKANGELGPGAMKIEVLSRINLTREELRYARSYAPGTVLEVDRRQRGQGLQKGSYTVVATDLPRERVTLQNERGRQFEFRPGQLRPQGEQDPVKLYERRDIEIHDGDRIRWTDTDHRRGLLNADQARIIAIDAKGVSLATSVGVLHRLAPEDPMLKRLDLAYALNAHMAQGLTSDRGIAVMDSREKNLANQQTFLVTITRLRDGLKLFVDNPGKLEAAVENNPGMKRSALETVDLLRNAAATGAEKGRASEAERKAPELDRSISKKFDMGL